jgi:hypothetical protein
MGSHDPFGHLQHKLWPKERPGVKLPIGSLTHGHGKSGIDPIPLHVGGVRHVFGKLSMRATTLVQTSSRLEVCTILGNFGTPTWEFETKSHSDATPAEWCRVYYMGEGGGFP